MSPNNHFQAEDLVDRSVYTGYGKSGEELNDLALAADEAKQELDNSNVENRASNLLDLTDLFTSLKGFDGRISSVDPKYRNDYEDYLRFASNPYSLGEFNRDMGKVDIVTLTDMKASRGGRKGAMQDISSTTRLLEYLDTNRKIDDTNRFHVVDIISNVNGIKYQDVPSQLQADLINVKDRCLLLALENITDHLELTNYITQYIENQLTTKGDNLTFINELIKGRLVGKDGRNENGRLTDLGDIMRTPVHKEIIKRQSALLSALSASYNKHLLNNSSDSEKRNRIKVQIVNFKVGDTMNYYLNNIDTDDVAVRGYAANIRLVSEFNSLAPVQ